MIKEVEFNSPIKENYYDSLGDRVHLKKKIKFVFRRISDFEEKFDKQIEEFSKDEILSVYKALLTEKELALSTVLNTHTCLLQYIDACFENNTVIDSISREEIKKMSTEDKNVKKIFYQDLQEKLTILKNPSDQFILLGLFEGIKGDYYCELGHSTMRGANSKNKSIWLAAFGDNNDIEPQARIFYASEQLFEYAQRSAAEYYYHAQIGSLSYNLRGREIIKWSDLPYSGSTGAKACENRLRRRIHLILDFIGWGSITSNDIKWSGIWYSLQKIQTEKNLNVINDVFKTPEYQIVKSNYQLPDRSFEVIRALRKHGYL